MILIADGGSTKTIWRLGSKDIKTLGINPVRDSEAAISATVSSLPDAEISDVFYYGAGCIAPFKEKLQKALADKYPSAMIRVETDMMGAARALCGHKEGVVCILGTGSNSCYYDGEIIVSNVPPLGYVLGDEGSGAALGRILVGDLLKGQLSTGLKEDFLSTFNLTPATIIDRVYCQPMPNRFLASLVPFIICKRNDASIHDMVVAEFRRFFIRNVAQYRRHDLPVGFVGGVAHSFSDELKEAAEKEGFRVGVIVHSPISGLATYHLH